MGGHEEVTIQTNLNSTLTNVKNLLSVIGVKITNVIKCNLMRCNHTNNTMVHGIGGVDYKELAELFKKRRE